MKKLNIIGQKSRIFTAGYAQLINKIKGLDTNPLDAVTIIRRYRLNIQ